MLQVPHYVGPGPYPVVAPFATDDPLVVVARDTLSFSTTIDEVRTQLARVVFAIKRQAGQPDPIAVALADSSSGLTVLDGATPGLGESGAVSLTNDTDVAVFLTSGATSRIRPGEYVYAIKAVRVDGTEVTHAQGRCEVRISAVE